MQEADHSVGGAVHHCTYIISRVYVVQGYRGCEQIVNGFITTHVTSAYLH